MKKTEKILLGAAGIAIVTGFIVFAVRRHRLNQRNARVAEEGYETAGDILYPGKRHKRKKLHYGPVLPQ